MFRRIRIGLISLAALALVLAPIAAEAQRVVVRHPRYDAYWDNYWGWYDNSYRPYYHRHHRDYPDADPRYHPHSYPRRYYYDDGHAVYGPHNSLEIGPLHLDWR